MASLATTDHVAGMFRALTPAESAVIQSWLDYLSAQVRIQVAGVDARMVDDSDYTDLVVGTVANAAVRVLRNPDGWRQWSVDDASFTRDQVVSAGLLYLTQDELAQLRTTHGLPTVHVVSLSG